MNPVTFSTPIKFPEGKVPPKREGPGRYSHMYNAFQRILDVNTYGSTLVIMFGNRTNNFLVNHRLTMDPQSPRYAFHCEYAKDNLLMNTTWLTSKSMRGQIRYKMNENLSNEFIGVVLPDKETGLRGILVNRTIYEDEDSSAEFTMDNSSGVSMTYLQSINAHYDVGMEGYYDFLANQLFHAGVSLRYHDIMRSAIATVTSNYSLYMFYLRTVNKNVSLAAQCTLAKLNSVKEMRATSLIGFNFNLPKTKAEITTTVDMTGTVKSCLKEQLTANSTISFSAEMNPWSDRYKFGVSFAYGERIERWLGFTPLMGSQY